MSDKPQQEATGNTTPAKADNDKPAEARNGRASQPARSGGGLAWFLLLVVLAGGAAGGWFGWQWLEAERGALQGQFNAQQDRLENLAADLRALEETRASVAELEALATADKARSDALEDRLQGLESSMDALRDAAEGGRRALVQAEVEYLLRIAADELYLTGDVNATVYALQAADDRLRDLADPRYLPVRERIATHLAALAEVSLPDVSGMAVKLSSMQKRVADLPLAQSAHASDLEDAATADTEAGWLARLDALWERLSRKLINVQPAEPPRPLLSPEDSFFLARNLELQLAAARAALLRSDARSYRDSLEMARRWLADYFDSEDGAVKIMLADMNGLLDINLQPELPDVTPALEEFRRINGNGVRD
ncbi:MAG: uroporphyrinogen-III C-methyltransferase [Gammaproteobacteria bacterium]|nr:uroporphyrinogen-III C-methyltransferase [Gammaproteobacteria bacterium]